MTLFTTMQCEGDTKKSPLIYGKGNKPFFFQYKSSFEFYAVPDTAIVVVNLYENALGGSDLIGSLEFNVADIAASRGRAPWMEDEEVGMMYFTAKKLEEADTAHMKLALRYVPCTAS